MSKIITSPSKRWPGSVTIADPITLPQAEAINDARRHFYDNRKQEGEYISYLDLDKPRIPAIMACVEKWELKDFPVNGSIPMSPEKSRHTLVNWIWKELEAIYDAEDEVPNE
jgi:hypothetical protein